MPDAAFTLAAMRAGRTYAVSERDRSTAEAVAAELGRRVVAVDARGGTTGALAHPPREPWPVDGVSLRGLRAALSGSAGALARACLNRGYPVEQELAAVEALRRRLS